MTTFPQKEYDNHVSSGQINGAGVSDTSDRCRGRGKPNGRGERSQGALSGQDSTTRLAVDQRRLVSGQRRGPNVAALKTVICAFSIAATGNMPSRALL
jgi:hypothetical protein